MTTEYKLIQALLDPNIYSRPRSLMKDIRGICIHWVGNANTTAINNRHYFNNLPVQNQREREKAKREGREPNIRYASSHEIIGLDGEIVICIPKHEVAFHAGGKSYKQRVKVLLNNSPNRHLYGIENCHPDWSGKFNPKTSRTLINRAADLLIEFNLKPSKDTIWRHFDVTGKNCPRYYVNNQWKWDKLIRDITDNYNAKMKSKTKEVIEMTLQKWQQELGEESINNLSKRKAQGQYIINNPDEWKNTLGKEVPQWLFWTIIDRITEGD